MENKKKFVEGLSTLLVMYSREKIIKLKYTEDDAGEFIEIICTNSKKYINITGDSCTAIMHDIYRVLL